MTPRRKNKNTSTDGEDSANLTKKRGRNKDNSSPPAASPPTVRRSQRRTLAQASPSQDECEATPKKSRQAGPSPETPSRVSPRGKKENSSPIPSRTSPRGDRRSLRGSSTDSGASNVSNAAINCASADRGASSPARRRTRRESNSSSISATSDTSSITPTTPRRGRGSKRKVSDKSDKGEVESSKEANGPSPQYSPNTKRRRGRSQAEISPLTTNGKSEEHVRPKRRICKTFSPQKVLDEGVDETIKCLAGREEEDVKNSVDSAKKLENFKIENGNDASAETDDGAHVLTSASATCDGEDLSAEVNSKDRNKLLERETCKDSKDTLDVTSQGESQNLPSCDTDPRTGSSSPLLEKHRSPAHTCKTIISSSHVNSAKRTRSISDSSNHEIAEQTLTSKKTKLCASVPDDSSDRVKCENGSVKLEEKKQEAEEKWKSSDPLPVTDMEAEVSIDHVDSVAKGHLEIYSLTDEQILEIFSSLTTKGSKLSESTMIEELVEKLLNRSTSVRSMNAPRFNKFLRQLLNRYCCLDTSKESKHSLCEKAVQWARDRKSVNLRHELELTLMSLYYNTCHYKKAEGIADALYNETKKLQDKEKTVKACLCLSQVYHAMGNISKARANITTAKTEALKIYTPPDMQGELDLQSGIMQVAEGKDMETAFSYFKEAATGFVSHKQRARALKYMLLSKIMMNRSEEGEKAVRSQSHIQDIDEGVEAMLAIAGAAHRSSLMEFRKLREVHKEHLAGDLVVAGILDDLYTTMMEKNLLNIVLPYECIQIGYVAEKIGLPREEVERRVSQMILDKRINAQLDHRDDCLYVYASVDSDVVYQTGLKTLTQLDKTISHLNRKVKKLL
ncbi:uncharacterized protein LOC135101368 [Scylla paramamosain]|uniref:uncharacterized protein LOC135101368 n=1 Tax=Scylla paramamosain TaxID=85552 RepID=UPI003083D213